MNNLSKMASAMGKKGGKKSAEKRFSGKTDDEIRAIMRAVRKGKTLAESRKETDKMMGEFLTSLNSID